MAKISLAYHKVTIGAVVIRFGKDGSLTYVSSRSVEVDADDEGINSVSVGEVSPVSIDIKGIWDTISAIPDDPPVGDLNSCTPGVTVTIAPLAGCPPTTAFNKVFTSVGIEKWDLAAKDGSFSMSGKAKMSRA